MSLDQRYQAILEAIARAQRARSVGPAGPAGKGAGAATAREVTLIAVSKGQPAASVESLYRLGHRDFGENYAQEFVEKAVELEQRGCSGIRWHFIGHLQSNKAAVVAERAHFIHSVDSFKLASRLGSAVLGGVSASRLLPVFIEVNIDEEPSKSGVLPADVEALARGISELKGLILMGLMCIPAPSGAGDDRRRPFRALRELEAGLRPFSAGMLSMGMSSDFEVAVLEGATHVRVGTAIFGERRP